MAGACRGSMPPKNCDGRFSLTLARLLACSLAMLRIPVSHSTLQSSAVDCFEARSLKTEEGSQRWFFQTVIFFHIQIQFFFFTVAGNSASATCPFWGPVIRDPNSFRRIVTSNLAHHWGRKNPSSWNFFFKTLVERYGKSLKAAVSRSLSLRRSWTRFDKKREQFDLFSAWKKSYDFEQLFKRFAEDFQNLGTWNNDGFQGMQ